MFSKNKNKDLLKAQLPFIYKHFYFNLNKEMGVYMELYPNQDNEGKYKYSENKNIGWILKIRILNHLPGYEKGKTEGYIKTILDVIELDFVTLYSTDVDD
ncbi:MULTISPECIES: hypothetical protein [Lysinibacillus]|uniref:hypothetical protein n=1 Tax=Lysinibacillus TaxID=400634 RepID=UPI0006B0699C|nr:MULTISPECIES: hypothetical protein [Lysinibacillus]